jgi:hypothetical protein
MTLQDPISLDTPFGPLELRMALSQSYDEAMRDKLSEAICVTSLPELFEFVMKVIAETRLVLAMSKSPTMFHSRIATGCLGEEMVWSYCVALVEREEGSRIEMSMFFGPPKEVQGLAKSCEIQHPYTTQDSMRCRKFQAGNGKARAKYYD